MKTTPIRLLLTLLVLPLLACFLSGCHSEGERCSKCGMLVDENPRWIAGLVNESDREQRFCSPRCMFAWLRSPRGTGAKDAWATEYYGQTRRPVEELFFVMGSDLTGPMGKSLVPVAERPAAERFMEDHQGSRVLSADEITADLLKEVAGRSP